MSMNLTVENKDIEGCHRNGDANPKITIIRFLNRKFCNLILNKKNDLKKIGNTKHGFKSNITLFVSENFPPCS